jgi:hypothetical protein
MAEEERKKGFGRKVWEVFQTIGAGAGVIALQHAIEEALMGAGKKAGEKAGEKVHEFFGLSPDPSGEGQIDNAVVDKVANLLQQPQRKNFRDFCQELYNKDPGKFKRFTGRIALLTELDAEKKTIKKRPPKGRPGSEEIIESKKRDYDTAKNFIEELLAYPDYDSRLAFLEGAGVFEKEKDEAPGITFLKETATKVKEVAGKAATATKDFTVEKATQADQTVSDSAQDFNTRAISWADRMKAQRDAIRRS